MRRHVSIFLPRPTPFYEGLLTQLRSAFLRLGVEAEGLCRHLEGPDLQAWCDAHKPTAIFEMNRPRRDVPSLPRDIKHIVWVVDFNGRDLSHFEGSDLTYLFSPGWPALYPHRGFHRWLGPGSDPDVYRPTPRPRDLGATFVGHIPRPWSEQELARDLTGGAGHCRFVDVLPELEAWFSEPPGRRQPALDDALEVARDRVLTQSGCDLVADASLTYDIRGRVVRHLRRRRLLDAVCDHVSDVHIYGPSHWLAWPRYAPFYRGALDRPDAMSEVYGRSQINFHEGNGVHFRSMDVLASGGLLFYREHWHDPTPGGIARVFEPGVHYVPFREDNLPEQIARFRDDEDRRAQMCRAAAAEIRRAHTWTHRAREILDDLADAA